MSVQSAFEFDKALARQCYFALRPAMSAARVMTKVADDCCKVHGLSGRPYDEGRFHLSLNPVISRRGPRKGDIDAAFRAAERVRMAPFAVAFGCVCTFRVRREKRPTVLCCSSGADKLAALRGKLCDALGGEGLWRGAVRFEPHLTLLWDRSSVPKLQLGEPIVWTVVDFVLLETIYGEGRQVEWGRWPLHA